jgi:hypothetical protein
MNQMGNCRWHLRKEVTNFLRQNSSRRNSLIGTGFFFLPDPAGGRFARKKIKVANLTLEETVIRSNDCLAATWVPNEIVKFEDILDECSGSCESDEDCDQNWGCFCDTFPGGTMECT